MAPTPTLPTTVIAVLLLAGCGGGAKPIHFFVLPDLRMQGAAIAVEAINANPSALQTVAAEISNDPDLGGIPRCFAGSSANDPQTSVVLLESTDPSYSSGLAEIENTISPTAGFETIPVGVTQQAGWPFTAASTRCAYDVTSGKLYLPFVPSTYPPQLLQTLKAVLSDTVSSVNAAGQGKLLYNALRAEHATRATCNVEELANGTTVIHVLGESNQTATGFLGWASLSYSPTGNGKFSSGSATSEPEYKTIAPPTFCTIQNGNIVLAGWASHGSPNPQAGATNPAGSSSTVSGASTSPSSTATCHFDQARLSQLVARPTTAGPFAQTPTIANLTLLRYANPGASYAGITYCDAVPYALRASRDDPFVTKLRSDLEQGNASYEPGAPAAWVLRGSNDADTFSCAYVWVSGGTVHVDERSCAPLTTASPGPGSSSSTTTTTAGSIPTGSPSAIVSSGQIGRFRIGETTAAEIEAALGPPDQKLVVRNTYLPGNPVSGVMFVYDGGRTRYGVNAQSGRLAQFSTDSPDFVTSAGTRVGMTTAEAEKREGQVAPAGGCIPGTISRQVAGGELDIVTSSGRVSSLDFYGKGTFQPAC